MTTFIIVRHAQSVANLQKVFAGHYDIDLSALGFTQAEKAAAYIQAHYPVDKVYASDLKRTCQTAQPIAKLCNAELVTTPELREIFAGEWEGVSFEQLQKDYDEDYTKWRTDIGNAGPTGGETVKQVSARIWKKLREIAAENENKTVAIVTHATPVRTIVCPLKGLSFDEMPQVVWVPNASITIVQTDGKEWKLVQAGIDEHLADCKTVLPPNV